MMKGNFTIFFTALFPSLGGIGSQGGCWITIFQMSKCILAEHALTHTLTQLRTTQPVSHAGKAHVSHRTECMMRKEPDVSVGGWCLTRAGGEKTFMPSTQTPRHSTACVLSHSAVFDSLRSHGLKSSRLLSSWDVSGKNTGVGCHFLLQGIFPTQESNCRLLCLLHCRWIFFTHWAIGEELSNTKTIFSSGNLKIWENQHVSNENYRGLPSWSSG